MFAGCPFVPRSTAVFLFRANLVRFARAVLPSDVLSGRSKICSCRGDDASDPYVRGAKLAVIAAQTQGAQFALLKARSPSCSPHCIYDGTFSGRLVPGRGIAAQALADVGIELFSEETVEALIDRIRSLDAAASV